MRTNNIHISVLIPVYNVEKYVERCILSVLNQTMQEGVEVIIVNDCTPDSSMDIIAKVLNTYSDKYSHDTPMKIHIINHDKNRGSAAARNTAISHATGDYIVQVDSDDYIEPEMLATMYNKATEENADIVICDYYITFKHKRILFKQTFIDREQYFQELIAGEHAIVWNKMIKRNLFIENSIQHIEGLDAGEDYVVMLPLMLHAKKISYIPLPFYNYVKYNPNAITKSLNEKSKRNLFERIEYAKNFINTNQIKGCEKSLAYLILSEKARLINYCSPEERKHLYTLFPETNQYLASFLKETSLQNKLLLKGYVTLWHIIVFIKSLVKIILRKN